MDTLRRALSVDELRTLLATTRGQAERHGITGLERALLYRLGVETGFERGNWRAPR